MTSIAHEKDLDSLNSWIHNAFRMITAFDVASPIMAPQFGHKK